MGGFSSVCCSVARILDLQKWCVFLRNGVILDSENDKRKNLKTLANRFPLKFMICETPAWKVSGGIVK